MIYEDIIKGDGIEIFGTIRFDDISQYLINCSKIRYLPQNAKAVICMLFPYKVDILNHNLSKYACIQDYHIVAYNILKRISLKLESEFTGYTFTPFLDDSPIPEVYSAAICGLGVVGDNNLLINSKYGSYVFIGEIVTDLNIASKALTSFEPKTCLHCKKCRDKCPGHALCVDGFNKGLCASYLTQKKGELTELEEDIIKSSGSVWGCDICQDVCPLNKNSEFTYIREFNDSVVPYITKENLTGLTNRAFLWRPKEVIERNIELFKF